MQIFWNFAFTCRRILKLIGTNRKLKTQDNETAFYKFRNDIKISHMPSLIERFDNQACYIKNWKAQTASEKFLIQIGVGLDSRFHLGELYGIIQSAWQWKWKRQSWDGFPNAPIWTGGDGSNSAGNWFYRSYGIFIFCERSCKIKWSRNVLIRMQPLVWGIVIFEFHLRKFCLSRLKGRGRRRFPANWACRSPVERKLCSFPAPFQPTLAYGFPCP